MLYNTSHLPISLQLFLRYALAIIAVIFFVLIDWFSLKWFETGRIIYVPLLMILALSAYRIFGWLSHTSSLSLMSGLINTGIVIGTIFLGVFVRHDVLDSQQKMGLLAAVAAVALLTIHA